MCLLICLTFKYILLHFGFKTILTLKEFKYYTWSVVYLDQRLGVGYISAWLFQAIWNDPNVGDHSKSKQHSTSIPVQTIKNYANFTTNFLLLLPFSAFWIKNVEKVYYEQLLESTAPTCWLKYSVLKGYWFFCNIDVKKLILFEANFYFIHTETQILWKGT